VRTPGLFGSCSKVKTLSLEITIYSPPYGGLVQSRMLCVRIFTRKEEYEADAYGVDILQRAGYEGKQVMGKTLTWLLQTSARAEGLLQPTLAPKTGSSGFTICLRPSTQDLNQGLLLQISNHLHPCAEC